MHEPPSLCSAPLSSALCVCLSGLVKKAALSPSLLITAEISITVGRGKHKPCRKGKKTHAHNRGRGGDTVEATERETSDKRRRRSSELWLCVFITEFVCHLNMQLCTRVCFDSPPTTTTDTSCSGVRPSSPWPTPQQLQQQQRTPRPPPKISIAGSMFTPAPNCSTKIKA